MHRTSCAVCESRASAWLCLSSTNTCGGVDFQYAIVEQGGGESRSVRIRRNPVILPFYHSGMGRVMPEHGRIPRVGRQVDITVGQPLDVSDLTCRCGQPGTDQKQARHLPHPAHLADLSSLSPFSAACLQTHPCLWQEQRGNMMSNMIILMLAPLRLTSQQS